MIASKKIEKLESSSVKLSVTVPKEELKREYDALIREYSKNIRIDGFRAGHVPSSVLERKFGDSLRLDAMGRVMEKAMQEAIEEIEEKPLAYAQPSLVGEPSFTLDADFDFAVTYDVFPSVEINDWKGLEFEVPQVEISDADEERELAEIRERNAIVVEKDASATVDKGDVLTVAYREIGEDGATVAGSERSDFTFEVGTGYNLYKFDDEVMGMKVGEEKILDKSYPSDFEYKDLAGRSLKVAVTVSKIKQKKLPELDDDLAQDVSEKFSTLRDLKDDIKKRLERRLSDKLRQLKEKAIVEGLLARSKYELPKSMVDAELAMRLEGLKRQSGIDAEDKLDRILSYKGKTRESLTEEWRPSAEKAIATRLVLEKLASEGKYECSEEELEAEFARQGEDAGISVADVKAEYEKRGSIDYIRDRVKEDKLMTAILAEARLKNGAKLSYVDLLKDSE